MKKILSVIATFLKVGLIGFGGGSALIPVVDDEAVKKKQLVSDELYETHVINANITPGALPVKLGEAIGEAVSGPIGGFAGAFAVALPGALLTVLLVALMQILSAGALNIINMLSIGISVFIFFLLIHYIGKVLRDSKSKGFFAPAVLLLIAAVILTCGKELHTLVANEIGWEIPLPILFDVSTIDLLLVTFFVIFFTGGKNIPWRTVVASVLSLAFVLSAGKLEVAILNAAKPFLLVAMLVLSVVFVVLDTKKERAHIPQENEKKKVDLKVPLLTIALFLGFAALCLLVCVLIAPDKGAVLSFALNGAISTVTSFGGGEAYISVASGIFLGENGILSDEAFYTQILPVANALPGPILVKILTAVAYAFGFSAGGVSLGAMYALLGFAISVGFTCVVFIAVYCIYQKLSDIAVFKTLKLWILPVICGLLVTTILSMLIEMFKITGECGLIAPLAVLLFVGLYVLTVLLKKVIKNDVLLLLVDGGVALLVLLLVG